MATALPLATAFTDASTTEAQLKTALTNERAALAEMGDPMGRHGVIQNLSLAFSVGSNALTCNVKTRAGATASATDPVSAALRNATLATGDFNVRNITAALSLVISSGSTLGHLNATAGFIYWYLIDNAGTLELAASTAYLGTKGIVTTVAEGGAGAADSATVTYSATARSSVPFILVARTTDTQTTAGTWAAVPSAVELAPLDVQLPQIVKRKTADESVTSSTTLQDDDHLTFPLGANEEWVGSLRVACGGSLNTTGAKIAFTVPAGCTLEWNAFLMPNVAADISSARGTSSGSSSTFSPATSVFGEFHITLFVLNGSTAGNVTLQWAQGSSIGTALTFRKGSQLVAFRVA